MASPFTTRQAGLASITAAALILVSQVSQLALPLFVTESFWIATQSLRMGLAMVAMFALLIALTALYARQAPETGKLGLAGYLTAFLGTLLVAGNWWYEAFIGPVLRQQAPELLATAPSGSILFGGDHHGCGLRRRLVGLRVRQPSCRHLPAGCGDPDDDRRRGRRPDTDLPLPDPVGPRRRMDGAVAHPLGRPRASVNPLASSRNRLTTTDPAYRAASLVEPPGFDSRPARPGVRRLVGADPAECRGTAQMGAPVGATTLDRSQPRSRNPTKESPTMTNAISMVGLTKHYKGVQALTDLTLDVPAGTIFGFLGPNGAGKTTTLKILAGLARPTAGEATLNGVAVSAAGDHRRELGYLSQDPRFYGWMTGRETLRDVARFHGSGRDRRHRFPGHVPAVRDRRPRAGHRRTLADRDRRLGDGDRDRATGLASHARRVPGSMVVLAVGAKLIFDRQEA